MIRRKRGKEGKKKNKGKMEVGRKEGSKSRKEEREIKKK
jgi:hypothetical protein